MDMDLLKLAQELMLQDDTNSSGVRGTMAEEGLSWRVDMLFEHLPRLRGGVGFRGGDKVGGVEEVVEKLEFGFEFVGITTKEASKISANPANIVTIRQGRVFIQSTSIMHSRGSLSATGSVTNVRGLAGTAIPRLNCIE